MLNKLDGQLTLRQCLALRLRLPSLHGEGNMLLGVLISTDSLLKVKRLEFGFKSNAAT